MLFGSVQVTSSSGDISAWGIPNALHPFFKSVSKAAIDTVPMTLILVDSTSFFFSFPENW
jgi:hypothetical protein